MRDGIRKSMWQEIAFSITRTAIGYTLRMQRMGRCYLGPSTAVLALAVALPVSTTT